MHDVVVFLTPTALVLSWMWLRKHVTWASICRFAFRRAMGKPGGIPTGLPGHRDPDSKCENFWPVGREEAAKEGGCCQTDGHYLCAECGWVSREALIERGLIQVETTEGI